MNVCSLFCYVGEISNHNKTKARDMVMMKSQSYPSGHMK